MRKRHILLFVYVSFSYQLLSKNNKYYDVVSDCCLYMSLSHISSFLRHIQTAVTHYIIFCFFLFLERSWYEKETYTNSSHSLHHNIFFVFRKELICVYVSFSYQLLSKNNKYDDVVSDCCLYMSLSHIGSFLKTKKYYDVTAVPLYIIIFFCF
jgi:hypothetical protein